MGKISIEGSSQSDGLINAESALKALKRSAELTIIYIINVLVTKLQYTYMDEFRF